MLPFGMKRAFSLCLIGGAVANLVLMVVLAPTFGARGAGMAVLATEIGVTVAMGLCLALRRPWRSQGSDAAQTLRRIASDPQ